VNKQLPHLHRYTISECYARRQLKQTDTPISI